MASSPPEIIEVCGQRFQIGGFLTLICLRSKDHDGEHIGGIPWGDSAGEFLS